MKLNRTHPVPIPMRAKDPQLWFYVNERSITVVQKRNDCDRIMSGNIPRRYLLAALKAMRVRQ